MNERKSMRLFSTLDKQKIFSDYAASLDWFLSDGKFDKTLWDNKNKVQAFTKAFHQMKGFSQHRFHYGSKKNIVFPKQGEYQCHPLLTFYIAKGESETKDLIRHIRNGIAHGNVGLHESNGELIVELLDFGKESVQADGQTAYMVFPLCFLNEIRLLYRQKEQKWKSNAAGRRRK